MVGQPTLYSFETTDNLSSALAGYVVKAQAEAFARHGKFKVAVSGVSV